MKNLCLFHGNCPDGFCSAFAVWLKYDNKDWDYLPVSYNEPPPVGEENWDKIFIVDFSYPMETIRQLEKCCQGLVVIDHHISCGCMGYQNLIYDESKSGAVLTFEYLFPQKEVPKLFLYVQDRDLWKWEMPNSREVNLGLEMLRNKELINGFEKYLELIDNDNLEDIKDLGKLLYAYKKKIIEEIANNAFPMDVLGYENVICCEVGNGSLVSEVGEMLREIYPEAPFILLYGINNQMIIVSLRGAKGEINLSELAKKNGGGGHFNASGFKIFKNNLLKNALFN